MATVNFTEMKHGTKAEYELLHDREQDFFAGTAQRLLKELASQAEETITGYKVTRLEHALQSATRAWREGADDDWIVGALFHDIGDGLSPQNHDRFAAEILRPFVRDSVVTGHRQYHETAHPQSSHRLPPHARHVLRTAKHAPAG